MSLFQALRDSVFHSKKEEPAARAVPRNPHPKCPVCQQPLQKMTAAGNTLEQCEPCGGMWLRFEALKQILSADAAMVEPHFTEARNEVDHRHNDDDPDRDCPDCNTPMENYIYAYTSEVWIDACPNDHGVWLDGGELRKLWDFKQRLDNPTPEEQAKLAAAAMYVMDKFNRDLLKANSDEAGASG